MRPGKDLYGKATVPEEYGETLNEFEARYCAHMLRALVGPPPKELQIGKSDAPDDYYVWALYGLKKDPTMDFGLQVEGNIAAYCKATETVEQLFKTYGVGTPKADEKILDDPNGNFKRSPNEFRASALVQMTKALRTFYEATESRAGDSSNTDPAKNAVIRSIALAESVRGAFGLANGEASHSIAGLPRIPSDTDRSNFDVKFPGVMKAWDTVGDAVRKDIAKDRNADRSERVPELLHGS
jgi:hypothetical protein